MNKLLYFASDFSIGLSALLTDQLLEFHKYGIDIVPIAGDGTQEAGLEERIREAGINLQRIPGLDVHTGYRKLVSQLCDIIMANDIKWIHVQNNWQLALMSGVKMRLLGKRKIKLIYTLHGFRHNSKWKSRIAQVVIGSGLFLSADKIICMCRYLKGKFSLLSYKIELIPLGVTSSFFTDAPVPLPSDNALHMIFPAQFRHGKNQDMIIRAFANHVKNTGDNRSTLTLPGAGEKENFMRDLAKKLGVADQVKFPGLLTKEQVREAYLKSNIGIVSSNSETFGQSIVEPFVLGRCVISTPVGIAPDIIRDGENGYIFNDEKQLTEIMDRLYSHPDEIATISANNFAKRDMFNWQKIAEAYDDAILKGK